MIALSSGHFSVDDQISDVVSYLSLSEEYGKLMETEFTAEFPEYNSLEWSGSWVDTEASGVDSDYMAWVIDWLEFNTPVMWSDGEPYLFEQSDLCPICNAYLSIPDDAEPCECSTEPQSV